MTNLRLDRVEREAFSQLWSVVLAFWIPLRQAGWTPRQPEFGGGDTPSSYSSFVSIDADGEDVFEEGFDLWLYDSGKPTQSRHFAIAYATEFYAGLVRRPVTQVPSTSSPRTLVSGLLPALEVRDKELAIRLAQEAKEGNYDLLASFILGELAAKGLDSKQLRLNVWGEKLWSMLLQIPLQT